MFCSNCGEKNNENSKFCRICGSKLQPPSNTNMAVEVKQESSLVQSQTEAETNVVAHSTDENKAKKKLFQKKAPIIAAALILIFLIPATIFFAKGLGLFNGKKAIYPVVYMKKNELVARDTRKDKATPITDKLCDDYTYDDIFGYGDFSYFATSSKDDAASLFFRFTKDGKKMLFLQNIREGEGYDEVADLYLRNIVGTTPKGKSTDKYGIKIASNILPAFDISFDGKYIVYMKNWNYDDGGSLYINDLKKEIKVAGDAYPDFQISDDGKHILYSRVNSNVSERDYYIALTAKEDSTEKIDSDINEIVKVTDNFEKIYYTKSNGDSGYDLYLKEMGKDKIKLFNDMDSLISIQEDGSIVYLKSYVETVDLREIVNDNMAATDRFMTMPYKDNYILYYDYYYYYSYPVYDMAAYNRALEQYYRKEERDEIRYYIANNPTHVVKKDLYIYRDGESEKVESSIAQIMNASENSSITYFKYIVEEVPKRNISDFSNAYAVENYYWENVNQKKDLYRYTKSDGNKLVLSKDDYLYIVFSEDNNYAYMKDFVEGKGYLLNKYDLSNTDNKETIATDVTYFEVYPDSEVIYLKDEKNSLGDLYLKTNDRNEKIAENVNSYSVFYDEDNKVILCLTDYNYERYMGKLVRISNFEKKVISDDVNHYFYRSPNEVLFTKEYRESRGDAELWLYNGKEKNIKIDDDVTNLLYY